MGGSPGVVFDGANDWLAGTTATITGDVTVVAAARFAHVTQPNGDYDYVVNIGSGMGAAGSNLSISRNNLDNQYYLWDGAAQVLGPALPGQTNLVIAQSITTASPRHQVWLQGTAQSVGAWTSSLSLSGGYQVGRFPGDNHYLHGAVGELLVIAGTVDTATRQRIEGYLAHKWGVAGSLPTDHPHRTTPPVA
jgi:hypothetical protein